MDDLLSIAVSNAVAATILALAAVAVGAVYRRPAVVHGLWLLVLLKLVTPPLLRIPIAWPVVAEPSPPEVLHVEETPTVVTHPPLEEPAAIFVAAPADEGESSAVEPPATVEESPSPTPTAPPEPFLWPQMLQILWGVGSLTWFLLALERLHRFRRLLRFARPAPAALQERCRRLAQALSLPRCPRIRLLPGRIAPMLWAIGGAPRLLVPADLLDVLSDEQLDTLLMHELAHLRRRDHWVRVLEFVVMGLYWWHPVVWYARRELREAEEQCCDAWVVSTLAGAGRMYASALLETLDFLSTAQAAVPPLASGLGHVADLKRRLTMIMRGTTPRSLSWPGCLAVITMGLTFLPMLPGLHGQATSKEEPSKSVADYQAKQAKQALDAAKARLEVEKALLEQQKVKIAHAENQLKAAAVRMEYQRAIQQAKLNRQDATTRELKEHKAGVVQKATYRIEITFPADGSVNPREFYENLRNKVPENSAIVLRLVSGTESSDIRLPPPKSPGADPHRNSPDTRINELEKKLEKVLRELQELRKQMKGPRPGSTTPSSSYRNPARIVPNPETPRPTTPSSPGNPYYAPTVPLAPDQKHIER